MLQFQHMAKQPLSIPEETKLVALIARGDTYKEIKTAFPDRKLNDQTIAAVKKRNQENLVLIADTMLQREVDSAMAIKYEANKQLARKLRKAGVDDKVLEQAREDWLAGTMKWKEYKQLLDKRKGLSVQELVSISKEMHTQSKEDETPPTNSEDMEKLVEAIKSGDEVKLNQIIFNSKNGQHNTPPEKPVAAS